MKRITVKVGSTFFIDNNGNVNTPNIRNLVREIAVLKSRGIGVCLVTSGAIAVGTKKMKLKRKPSATDKKQALAAIGQMSLMQIYEQVFDEYKLRCAQILLSHDDFGNRDRVNNLRTTLNALFDYDVVPVINENDAIATAEIKVGDNDTLSAMASLVIESSLLVLVSDVDGLYTANPNVDPEAKLIPVVDKIDERIIALAKAPSSEFGTGGMATKIKAAQITNSAGIPMMIVNRTNIEKLHLIALGENLGTYFKESSIREPLKKCWIKYCANVVGAVVCDRGAESAVLKRKSLLSCGITEIHGDFSGGNVVDVLNAEGKIIARGVCPFTSSELKKFVKDKSNAQLVIHANNTVII